ncbi:MAG: pantoate--beta-alanine ligase [Bacteroidetes bacterium]|jgi:pantoate--beta-alanine ligase|nr:pantoate--beta-alanine ligase [Bacteroidota bacterium]
MKVVHTIHHLQEAVSDFKKQHLTVGFVPTMGALHQGHISLTQRAKAENNVVVVSIFINPMQFNNADDFKKYPVTTESDLAMLSEAGCHLVFLPSADEVYTAHEAPLVFDLEMLDKVMEGEFRPGHFQGVITVVNKFFNWIKPDKAYFGEKDFQQLAVIRKMSTALHPDMEIIGCPTLREKNGLAMSSRNRRLSEQERKDASVIYESISLLTELKSSLDVSAAKNQVINSIQSVQPFKVEYLDIVNADTLISLSQWTESSPMRACIAVWCNEVRLIDNVPV